MKNSFTQLALIFSVFTGALAANAQTDARAHLPAVNLIEIKAEYYQGEVYHLGYAVNPDQSVNSIYYENNEHERRFFSFQELSGWKTIITNTTMGIVYDLVKLHAEPSDEDGTYNITMKYMTNGLSRWTEKARFTLVYNNSKKQFELKDKDALHLVRKVYVTTNYWGKTPVGIDQIISSQ